MCEIFGIGTDIVEISRMEKYAEDSRFLNRFFTDEEVAYIRSRKKSASQTMAGIYAAKEAAVKAMGTGIVFDLKEIGVTHDDQGKPEYKISGKASDYLAGRRICLSISHDGGMSVAFCVITEHTEG